MQIEKPRRKKLFVDPQVQGALILRVVLYWVVCLITITLMLVGWRIAENGTGPILSEHFTSIWAQFGPAMIASLVLLPLVVLDIVRLSNRFVGPLVRLRRALRALARGEHVAPISFRDGDFWLEFAQEFNALLARIQPASQPPVASLPPGSYSESTREPDPVS